eukprot:1637112-Rhodomonas_salina.5
MTLGACSGADRGVRLHDFFSGEAVWGVWGHAEAVTGLAVTHDLERLITTGADGLVRALCRMRMKPRASEGYMLDPRSYTLCSACIACFITPKPDILDPRYTMCALCP